MSNQGWALKSGFGGGKTHTVVRVRPATAAAMSLNPTAGSFLELLPPGRVEDLLERGQQVTYLACQPCSSSKPSAIAALVVLQGWVKTYGRIGSSEILLRITGPGDVVGLDQLGLAPAGGARSVALTDARLLLVPLEAFKEFIFTRPEVALALVRTQIYRQQHSDDRIVRRDWPMPRRLAAILVELVGRYGIANDQAIVLPFPLTQLELAELADSSRAVVARVLKSWRQDDVVETSYRELQVRDIRALLELSGVDPGTALLTAGVEPDWGLLKALLGTVAFAEFHSAKARIANDTFLQLLRLTDQDPDLRSEVLRRRHKTMRQQ
jgi:CRP/FNR family transcriptional regulator, cyclic AMP receptor protein